MTRAEGAGVRAALEAEIATLEARAEDLRGVLETLEGLGLVPAPAATGSNAGHPPAEPPSTPPAPTETVPGKKGRKKPAPKRKLRPSGLCGFEGCDYRGPGLVQHAAHAHPLPSDRQFRRSNAAELVAATPGGVTRVAKAMADRVGFGSAASLARYLNGEASPPAPVILALQEVLGVSAKELVETKGGGR